MSVGLFLKNTSLLYKTLPKVGVVLGNQSCDLDSIVSAIATSYYLSKADSLKSSELTFIPMLNSTKSVLESKQECMYLFEHLAVSLDDLIFISEWNKDKIDQVFLVDHNELDEQERSLCIHDLVCGVIDHHLDKGGFADASPRVIDPTAGSNASLITELFYPSSSGENLNDSFASMLLFPILSDTNNLRTRTSAKDLRAVEFLNQIACLDTQKMYAKLEELKFSASQDEDLETVLKKDYKQYETNGKTWGMSSINFCIQDWLVKSEDSDAQLDKVGKFMKERELSYFGMLSCFKLSSGDFKRDLILFGEGQILSGYTDEHISLIRTNEMHNSRGEFHLYDVDDVKYTRKYWQPSLEVYLKQAIQE
jgi:inorganic pyrophosphatase/exopolyphosphatase